MNCASNRIALSVILFSFALLSIPLTSPANHFPAASVSCGINGALIPVVKDELVISFAPAARGKISEFIGEYGLDLLQVNTSGDLHLLKLNRRKAAHLFRKIGSDRFEDVVLYISLDDRIRSAVPNSLCKASGYFMPDDPHWSIQWNLRRWDHLAMGRVWDEETGDDDIIIAVLDSGVAFEDYGDNLHTYVKMADYESAAFTPGYDFVNNDAHPNDDYNHGTHIAGIICSDLDNETGIAGMAPECAIMPVKILDGTGRGTVFTLIEGLDYAVENGADVINLSVSFPAGFIPGEALHGAIADAHDAGAVLVASSGNEGLSTVCYPAAFNECIAVGATTSDVRPARTEYSSWGAALDVVAPGGDTEDRDGDGHPDAILSTGFSTGLPCQDPGYWFGCGTSQAAAHVSALAGLLLANGAENSDVVRNAICKTAKDISPHGYDEYTGYGMISPYHALDRYEDLDIEPLSELEGYIEGTTGVGVPASFVGLVIQFPDRIAYFQEAEDGFFAFVEWNPPSDSIAVYQLDGLSPGDILDLPGGPFDYIDDAGGIIQWLNDTGGIIQWLNDTGGILLFLDDTGGIIQWLDDTGGIILFLDDTGDFVDYFNDAGGIIQWLDDTGGIILFLDDTGGIILFLDDTGGLLGLLDTRSMLYSGAMDIQGNAVNPLEGILFEELEPLEGQQ